MRLALILCLLAAPSGPLRAAGPAPTLALTLEGPVQWRDRGRWKDVELGQWFGPGDQLRCGEGGRLLLSLDAATSLALEPGGQLGLQRGPGGEATVALQEGRVDVLAEAADGPGLTLHSPNALVRAQGQEVELLAGPELTEVTVIQGRALLEDLKGLRAEPVGALERRRLSQGRLLAAETLAKREVFELDARWERARQFHGQRLALRQALLAAPERAAFARALRRRRAAP